MKTKISKLDNFWYVLMCVFTGGAVYFFRVIITRAIHDAFEEEKA